MAGKIINIKKKYQREFPKEVAVLICTDYMRHLVDKRSLVNKYETNRFIKYISTYYLLKAFSPKSGWLLNWTSQKKDILAFLQMNENTLRSHLKALQEIGLLQMHKKTCRIQVFGFETAADILGIDYKGTYNIQYDHAKTHTAAGMPVAAQKQTFQYLLRAEEFERQKEKQLNRIMHKLQENHEYFKEIVYLLTRMGADVPRLHTDREYLKERLLAMQLYFFKEGSEMLEYVYHARADINRGVKRIAQHHGYKSPQSVSYIKKRMWRLGIIQVIKVVQKSEKRGRLYFTDPDTGQEREGYKWLPGQKCTALFLCDQVSPLYETDIHKPAAGAMQKTA